MGRTSVLTLQICQALLQEHHVCLQVLCNATAPIPASKMAFQYDCDVDCSKDSTCSNCKQQAGWMDDNQNAEETVNFLDMQLLKSSDF